MQTIIDRIQAIRRQMGSDLFILGHHYQTSDILKCVDVSGDSLELSRKAAESTAKRIVFCGVRFMAETADILTRDPDDLSACRRIVYQPAPEAGCPMADMAKEADLEAAWSVLTRLDIETPLVPVVYVNSSAEVKAFCGRHGGSACTSGNGKAVLRHFLDRGMRIFFAPDEHLATNILNDLGYPDEAVVIYDPEQPNGGLSPEILNQARLVAWKGYCPIHCEFTIADVENARKEWPGCEIMIHPEAPKDVTRACDRHGSTREIIAWINSAADTEKTYVIGTEYKLVQRLMQEHPELKIHPLRKAVCQDMDYTTPEKLLRVLEEWPDDTIVRIPDRYVADARLCVERMLKL